MQMTFGANHTTFIRKVIENVAVPTTGFLSVCSDNAGLDENSEYYYIDSGFVGDWYKLYQSELYRKLSDTDYELLEYGTDQVGLQDILSHDYTVVVNGGQLNMYEYTTQSLFYKVENGTTKLGTLIEVSTGAELDVLLIALPFRYVKFTATVVETTYFNHTFPEGSYYYFDNVGYYDVSGVTEVFTHQDTVTVPNWTMFKVGLTPTFYYHHDLLVGQVWKTNNTRTNIELQSHMDCYAFQDVLDTPIGDYMHINNDFFTQRAYSAGQILRYVPDAYSVYSPSDDETFLLLSGARVTSPAGKTLACANSSITFTSARRVGYMQHDYWIVREPSTATYYYIDADNIYRFNGTAHTSWEWDGNGQRVYVPHVYNVTNVGNTVYIYDEATHPEDYVVNHAYSFDCTELTDFESTYYGDVANVVSAMGAYFVGP